MGGATVGGAVGGAFIGAGVLTYFVVKSMINQENSNSSYVSSNVVSEGIRTIASSDNTNVNYSSYDTDKQKLTTGNPAAQNKASAKYNGELQQQPPSDPSGNNNNGNGNKGKKILIGTGVGATATGGLTQLVGTCQDEKKDLYRAKKELEKIQQKNKSKDETIPEIKKD